MMDIKKAGELQVIAEMIARDETLNRLLRNETAPFGLWKMDVICAVLGKFYTLTTKPTGEK